MTTVDESPVVSEAGPAEATSEVPKEANGRAKAGPSRRGRARTRATQARARVARLRTVLIAWWNARRAPTTAEESAPRVRRSSIWSQSPPSVDDVVAYTRSGAWVPGDQHPLLENAGKAYGYVVAVPVTVSAYAVAFVFQRPVRLLATVAFLVLLVVSL